MMLRRQALERKRVHDRHSVHVRSQGPCPPPGNVALTGEAASKFRAGETLYRIQEIKAPEGKTKGPAAPPHAREMIGTRERFGVSGRQGMGAERLAGLVSSLADSASSHLNAVGATDSVRLREARNAIVQGVCDRTQRMKWRRTWLRGLTQPSTEAVDLDHALSVGAAPRRIQLVQHEPAEEAREWTLF